MSRDLGCRGLLQAGLASPHPSPLEGCPVVALTAVHTLHNTTHHDTLVATTAPMRASTSGPQQSQWRGRPGRMRGTS